MKSKNNIPGIVRGRSRVFCAGAMLTAFLFAALTGWAQTSTNLNIVSYFGWTTNIGSQPVSLIQGPDGTLYGVQGGGGIGGSGSATQPGGYNFGNGGQGGAGVIFSMSTNPAAPNYTVLKYFGNATNDGWNPCGSLTLVGNTLYGVTFGGGSASINGSGTVFAVNTDGTGFTNVYIFPGVNGSGVTNGSNPRDLGGLVVTNGMIYGTTQNGGTGGNGVIFSVSTNGTGFARLHSFTGNPDGANPYAGLTLVGSTLYGTTLNGGTNTAVFNAGTVFMIGTDGTGYTNLHDFQYNAGSTILSGTPGITNYFVGSNPDGATPYGSLVYVPNAPNGPTLYGPTQAGGMDTNGAAPSFTNGVSTPFAFATGTTNKNSVFASQGTIFTINLADNSYRQLVTISTRGNGNLPYQPGGGLQLISTLVNGTPANLLVGCGAAGSGLFSVNLDGTGFNAMQGTNTLANLCGGNGAGLSGAACWYAGFVPSLLNNNTFYVPVLTALSGTNYAALQPNAGRIFTVNFTNNATSGILGFASAQTNFVFTNLNYGLPYGFLGTYNDAILVGGTLYGTVYQGGAAGNASGVVYSVGTNGSNFTVLWNFSTGTNGSLPNAGLSVSPDGSTLYGTTYYGGSNTVAAPFVNGALGAGMIFSLKTNGTSFKCLYNFPFDTNNPATITNGARPYGAVTVSPDGSTLYGTTQYGGSTNGNTGLGTVYSIGTNGANYTTLHSFLGGADGSSPAFGNRLILTNGMIYGVTASGGGSSSTNSASGNGVAYAISANGSNYTILHTFAGGSTDGIFPYGSMILFNNTLYGTTYSGRNGGTGNYNSGTIYSLATNGANYQIVHAFAGTANNEGANPVCQLGILNSNTLCGTTLAGGTYGKGTIFALVIDGGVDMGYTNVYSFPYNGAPNSLTNGANPVGLSVAANQVIYGMAAQGGIGAVNSGLVYAFNAQPTSYTPTVSPTSGSGYYSLNTTNYATITGESNTTIYYTTDGSVPTTNSPSVTSATNTTFTLALPPTSTNGLMTAIQFFAVTPGDYAGAISSNTFFSVATPTWIQPAGGSWTNNLILNWSNNVVANAIGVTADFSEIPLTTTPTVTLDNTNTVGSILFGDQNLTNGWNIVPGALAGSTNSELALNTGTTNQPVLSVIPTNSTVAISTLITSTNGFVKTGAGTLVISNTFQVFGLGTGVTNTLPTGGILSTNPAGGLYQGDIVVSNGTLAVTTTYGNVFSPAQYLGASTNTVTIISNATLSLGFSAALNATVIGGSNATLNLLPTTTVPSLSGSLTNFTGTINVVGIGGTNAPSAASYANGVLVNSSINSNVTVNVYNGVSFDAVADYGMVNVMGFGGNGAGNPTLYGALIQGKYYGQVNLLADNTWLGGNASIYGPLTDNGNGYGIAISYRLSLYGTNNYTGPTMIGVNNYNGTLSILGAGQLGTNAFYRGNITFTASNSSLVYGSSVSQTLGGVISGPGGIQADAGNLILTNADTYSGSTLFAGGTVTLTSTAAITNTPVFYDVYANPAPGTLNVSALPNGFTLGANQAFSLCNYGTLKFNGSVNLGSGTFQETFQNKAGITASVSVTNGTLTVSTNTVLRFINQATGVTFYTNGINSYSTNSGTGVITTNYNITTTSYAPLDVGRYLVATTNGGSSPGLITISGATFSTNVTVPLATNSIAGFPAVGGGITNNGASAYVSIISNQLYLTVSFVPVATNDVVNLGVGTNLNLSLNNLTNLWSNPNAPVSSGVFLNTGNYSNPAVGTNAFQAGLYPVSVNGVPVTNVNNTISYTPTSPGTDYITYAIIDGVGATATGMVTVVVQATTTPPVITPASGGYLSPQLVTITNTEAGATIYYTTNGALPTANSLIYTGPFTLPLNTNGITISASAQNVNEYASLPVSATYSTIVTPTWINPSVGPNSWTNVLNWSNNVPANAIGVTADFSQLNLTNSQKVTLDSTDTVGTLIFGDGNTGNTNFWNVAPGSGGYLVLNNNANPPVISVATNVNVALSAALAGANGLLKTGGGKLTLAVSNSYTGVTTVGAGTLVLSGAGSIADSTGIVLGTNATLEIASIPGIFVANTNQPVSAGPGTANIVGNADFSAGALVLNFTSNSPALTESGGRLELSTNTVMSLTNSGAALGAGQYPVISGSGVMGSVPPVTVGGVGLASGTVSTLLLTNGELYLVVSLIPPVAAPVTVALAQGANARLLLSNLRTNWSDPNGLTVGLAGVSATSSNGTSLFLTSTYIYYPRATVNDQFTYSITNSAGYSATGVVNLVIIGATGQGTSVTVSGGTATVNFAGIPGYTYYVQRTPSLSTTPVVWTAVSTNVAPANGLFQFIDNAPPAGSAFYRLSTLPNTQ